MSWRGDPVVGAAVCFDWGGRGNWDDMHVGVVTSVLDGGRFRTIEGNYASSVMHVLRDMTYVRGFASFPFENDEVVQRMFEIHIPPGESLIANLKHPDGGEAILVSDGGVLCFDCPFNGNTVGKDYMQPDHKPARLELNPASTPQNGKPWYLIVDQHGHKYGDGGF